MINVILASILPWVTNMTENPIWVWTEPYTSLFGGPDIFFSFLFGVMAVGIYISKKSLPQLFGYLLLIDLFFAVLLPSILVLIFFLITVIVGAAEWTDVFQSK